jgi:serine/alanine adding enzyme
MYRLVELSDASRSEWSAFAERHGTAFHALAWKDVLERSFGYRGLYLILRDDRDGTIAALLPLMVGRNLRGRRVAVSLPFVNDLDLCCRDAEAFDALALELEHIPRTYGLSYLEVRLRTQELPDAAAAVNRNHCTFTLELERGEENLLAACSSSNRNHIRKAYRRGLFTTQVDDADLTSFYRVYARRQKQLGSPAPGIEFFRRIRAALPEQTTVLTVVEGDHGATVAGMFLVATGDTLRYLWGGSDIAYNRHHVNAFMYWEAVRYGLARGFRSLDLGRSSKSSGRSGTFAFKAQFGAAEEALSYHRFSAGAARTFADDRTGMSTPIEIWKRLPSVVTDPLGAFLIRYVLP